MDLAELESLRRQLFNYFCEDERTFKLDDCIKLVAGFFESFIKASQVEDCALLMLEKLNFVSSTPVVGAAKPILHFCRVSCTRSNLASQVNVRHLFNGIHSTLSCRASCSKSNGGIVCAPVTWLPPFCHLEIARFNFTIFGSYPLISIDLPTSDEQAVVGSGLEPWPGRFVVWEVKRRVTSSVRPHWQSKRVYDCLMNYKWRHLNSLRRP